MSHISEKELLELKDYILIDVRTPEEFIEEHLVNAKNIPVDELCSSNISFNHETIIVLYCRSGARSERAMEYLRELGYQAFNLGGYINFSPEFIEQINKKMV